MHGPEVILQNSKINFLFEIFHLSNDIMAKLEVLSESSFICDIFTKLLTSQIVKAFKYNNQVLIFTILKA